jgi:hypothetical protein
LPPVHFYDDQQALERFKKRLIPLLGNLVEVHEGIEREEAIAVESPEVMFTIESWEINGDRGYSLVDCGRL